MAGKGGDTAKLVAYLISTQINNFPTNRARIFAKSSRNGGVEKGDPKAAAGIPASCKCFQNKDTISVEFGFGFAGGMGFRQQIVGSSFRTKVALVTRHAKIYKAKLLDKEFESEIELMPLKETMTLLNKPTMLVGEQLTGFVTFQSKPFFERTGGNKADAVSVSINYFFTCKTLEKIELPDAGF